MNPGFYVSLLLFIEIILSLLVGYQSTIMPAAETGDNNSRHLPSRQR